MTLTKKTTHVADAQANLISEFRRRVDLDFFIESYVQELVELESVFFDILLKTLTVGNTTGANLDFLGAIVGEPRNNRNDTDYALAISVRILLNISSATIEDILAIVVTMVGPTFVVILTESFPAEFDITIDNLPLTTPPGDDVAAFVLSAKPVGVRAIFRWFEAALGTEFRFDSGSQGLDLGLLGDSVASS